MIVTYKTKSETFEAIITKSPEISAQSLLGVPIYNVGHKALRVGIVKSISTKVGTTGSVLSVIKGSGSAAKILKFMKKRIRKFFIIKEVCLEKTIKIKFK